MFRNWQTIDENLKKAADTSIKDVLDVQPDERVLIVTNPVEDVYTISVALHDAVLQAGGVPVLLVQPVKSQIDMAEEGVIKAIESEPDVLISMSAEKIGKDARGIRWPYEYNGEKFDHIFDFLRDGKKTMRAFWSPGVTKQIFMDTVPIDYERLVRESLALKMIFDDAVAVTVTSGKGTDVRIGIRNRKGILDNGDYRKGGEGGNLPAGETFISPENGSVDGVVVYDGSISLNEGEVIIREPIRVEIKNGFVSNIDGGDEAEKLKETLLLSEQNARMFEKEGKISQGMGEVYAKNARNIGELGIGLNPKAKIIGNMLVDEKAYGTCHIAIGSNYDNDAPCLTHLDGLVLEPTVTVRYGDGTTRVIMDQGSLRLLS